MPGTIHVSVLELVGLPSPPQSSSMGVKVSMGKQAHEMQDNKETSFALASLRDKLNVSIRDSEGSEIAHTDVETRSIVEKGTWDDLFPLKDGGHIRMRLHFILTENELNRIRSMRESAARKKQVHLQKKSHSSSDLAVASGDSLKSQHQTQERSVEPSDDQAKIIFTDSNDEVLNKAQPGQKKQAFSTSKSTGALDKLPAYQQLKERIQGHNVEQQSRSNKKPTNVRNLMLAIESSPVKATTQYSGSTMVDIPSKVPILKKMVTVNTEPDLSKLDSAPASVAQDREEIEKERRETSPDTNKSKKMVQSSSDTTSYIPAKVTNLKKVVINTEPVVSNLESAPALSTQEKVGEERRERLPVTDETKELGRLRSSTRVDNPFKVPILKKTSFANTKPVLSKFLTASATSTTGEIGKERGKLFPVTDKTKETDRSSRNTIVDTPKELILKKAVAVTSKAAPSTSTPEEIGKEKLFPSKNKTKETGQLSSNTRVHTPIKMPVLKKIVALSSKTDMSNSESASASSTSEKMGKGREKDKDYGSTHLEISDEYSISNTQPTSEESREKKKAMKKLHSSPISEKSIFSLKTLLEALPRRKQYSTDLFHQKYGYTTNDTLVIDKKWRSKQWKSSQCRASKLFDGNEHCSIDSLRGWIFLDEMIRSCVLSDDSPLLNVPEDCLSNCSQDNDQEKFTDTGLTERKSEKRSTGSKNLESNGRPDNISFTGPGGQVMKIAIMAGFGLLVFLTRQGK
ncbi:uncharacterized protein LOC110716891 isoform X2 [Chenopodium quinoa]|uniref:uncharacterized protein LOC110716891 isoform X2 n=1 Tax=Chenopodium quinoa TaxID=63459 RepID=UPI000B78039B|nr:uncharacterized protein LOC110716891 isoform X2 [Chenopodium quinoa]